MESGHYGREHGRLLCRHECGAHEHTAQAEEESDHAASLSSRRLPRLSYSLFDTGPREVFNKCVKLVHRDDNFPSPPSVGNLASVYALPCRPLSNTQPLSRFG